MRTAIRRRRITQFCIFNFNFYILKPAIAPINQNNLFMQNKPKSPIARINVTAALTAGYKNMSLPEHPQNKPKQSQNKAKTKPNKPN